MNSGPLSRRSALQLGGTALIGGLAGCSAFGKDASPMGRLTEPHITNWVEQAFEVDVHLLAAGNTVYWQTVQVDARDPDAGEHGQLGGARLDGFPDNPGEYVLYARLVSVEDDEPVRSNLAAVAEEADVSRLLVDLHIDTVGPRGGAHPSVSIAYSLDCGESGTDRQTTTHRRS